MSAIRRNWKDIALPLLAGLLCAYPFLLYPIGGDILIHYTYIQCFGDAFWQGDLYPRWCPDVRMRTGAPVFLFYFPVPYWISTVFYPLTWLELPRQAFFALLVFMAGAVSFIGARKWLSDIAGSRNVAALGAFFYLLLAYRSEVVYGRVAYSEMWLLAFLPWVLLYVRRMCEGDRRSALQGGVALAICLLCNFTGMFSIGICIALYAAFMARSRASRVALASSGALALGLTAFYYLPAVYYRPFTMPYLQNELYSSYPNRAFMVEDITSFRLLRFMILHVATALAALALFARIRRRRSLLPEPSIMRECTAWLFMMLLALALFWPPFSLLWEKAGTLKTVLFPWRLQAVCGLALAVFFTVSQRWLLTERKQKTRKADILVLFCLLALIPHFIAAVISKEDVETIPFYIAGYHPNTPEHISRWTPYRMVTRDYLSERFLNDADISKVQVLAGRAQARLQKLGSREIALQVQAQEPARIMIEHTYFPIWHVRQEEGREVMLSPQEVTGFMQLSLPPGEYTVTLYRDIGEGAPIYVRLAPWASMLTLIALLPIYRRQRRDTANMKP